MKFDNTIPIYIQLVEEIKIYIISGKIKTGYKLPSVRDLALQYKVNPNTMQKALSELEDLKLIYTERTNGKYVTSNQELIDKIKYDYAKEITNKYFTSMENIGLSKSDVIDCLNEIERGK